MGEKKSAPVEPDSHPEIKPGDPTPGVPYTTISEDAIKALAEAADKSGPVPLVSGTVHTVDRP